MPGIVLTQSDVGYLFQAFAAWEAEKFWSVVSEFYGCAIKDLSELSALRRSLFYGPFEISLFHISAGTTDPCLKLQFKCSRRPLDAIYAPHVSGLISDLKSILQSCLRGINWSRHSEWVGGMFPDEDPVWVTSYFDKRTAQDPGDPETYHLAISKEHHDGKHFVCVKLFGAPYLVS